MKENLTSETVASGLFMIPSLSSQIWAWEWVTYVLTEVILLEFEVNFQLFLYFSN